jgi:glycine hydroxymethyltransferase
MVVVRFSIARKGVRVPKLEDVVVDNHGRVIGQVTSCSMGSEGNLVGQAYIDQRRAGVGEGINIFPHPTREDWDKPYDDLELGDRLVLYSEATVVRRFMRKGRR